MNSDEVVLEELNRCNHSMEHINRLAGMLRPFPEHRPPPGSGFLLCIHCGEQLTADPHPIVHYGLCIEGKGPVCLTCDRDKYCDDADLLQFFLHFETERFLSLFLSQEFGRGQMQGRLIGDSIRAQVLSLRYPIRRRATTGKDDEMFTYDLPEYRPDPVDQKVVEEQGEHFLEVRGLAGMDEQLHQQDSTIPSIKEPKEKQGLRPLPESWLEILSGHKEYNTVIGVHFATGNEANFEHTLRGLIDNQHEEETTCTKRSLAIVFVDQPDYQWRPDSSLFAMLTELRLYDDSIAKRFLQVANQISDSVESTFAGRDQSTVDIVLAFESTVTLEDNRVFAKHTNSTISPCIDVLVVLKPTVRGMLHSHLWLMAGFCKYLRPKFVVTMDIDVEPVKGSLDILAQKLDSDEELAALCGELEIRTDGMVNIISGAQWFEFKMSYIMSKSVENLYGYVSALSPSFSMYRWKILEKELRRYFKPFVEPEGLSWTISNLYSVAPERVLSDILVNSKEQGCYRVEFTKDARALVGSVLTFQQFLKSKWQLVSGQWFYVLSTLSGTIRWPKGMSCIHKLTYLLFRVYFYLAVLFSYLSVAGLYLALSILARSALESDSKESYRYASVTGILQVLYLLMFVISLLISISRSVERLIEYWKVAMLIYGLLAVFFFSVSVYIIYDNRNNLQVNMALGCIGLVAFMLFPTIYTWAPVKSMVYSVCYLVMIPSYINILTAISITKTDEFMWTQALPNNTASKLTEFSRNRTLFINLFVILNVIIGGVLDFNDSQGKFHASYLLLGCSAGFLVIPLLLLLAYKFANCLSWVCSGVKSVGKCISSITNGE